MSGTHASLLDSIRAFIRQNAADGVYDSLYITRLPRETRPRPVVRDQPPSEPLTHSPAAAPAQKPAHAHATPPAPAPGAAVSPAPSGPPAQRDAMPRSSSHPAIQPPGAFVPPPGTKAEQLDALRKHIGNCPLCRALVLNRTQIVFGAGNPEAELVFVGEAPGEEEDRQGAPFVGRAGELLTRIIEKGMGMRRDSVYIANILKCRPPNNRNPEPPEVANCSPFLNAQLDIIKPRAIIALGAYASHYLCGTDEPISKLRGTFHHYRGIPVMPTFHPAYLLRSYSPENRRRVWDDVRKVVEFLNQK